MDHEAWQSIAEKAGYWDARLRAPDCTDEERRQFAQWRDAAPAHRAAYAQLQAIAFTLRQQKSNADLRAIRDSALTYANRRARRVTWAVAASVAVLTLCALIWAAMPRIDRDMSAGAYFSTGTAERATVNLQDGSIVELNSKSRIYVSYDNEHRSVELLEGQALFEVAHDPSRPFVVSAGEREIVALGTAFDVYLDPGAMRVTLIEGKVAVKPQVVAPNPTLPLITLENAPASNAPASEDTFYLSPGQQLVASRARGERASSTSVREIDVTKVTSWRAGGIFLDDVALSEAVAEMNKHSAIQIAVEDPALESLRVNGMFRAGNQLGFAHALEEYFEISAERPSETLIVLKRRPQR